MDKLKTNREWAVLQPTHVRGVDVLCAHYIQHSFDRHSHDCWSIGVTFSGNQTFRCRGSTTTSHRGDVIVFRPEEAHDGHADDDAGFRYAMLYLPDDLVTIWLKDGGHRQTNRQFRAALINDPACAAALMGAVEASLQPGESLRADTLLCSAVLQLFERHADHRPRASSERKDAPWLRQVREYIEAHYAQDVSVEDLANVAQVSRAHLTRSFLHAYGMPPHAHLNSIRLKAAKALLELNRPIAQVAIDVGYADQSHLTRRFKGTYGIAPGTWLKRAKSPEN